MNKELEKILYEASDELFIDEIYEKSKATTLEEQEEIKRQLQKEVDNYNIILNNGRYILTRKTPLRKGVFKSYKNYNAVLVGEEEFIIEDEDIHNAIDNDEVLVHIPYLKRELRTGKKISKRKIKKRRLNKVEIEKIINRDVDYLVGNVYKKDDNYYLRSDNKLKRKLKVILDGDNYTVGEKLFVKLNNDEYSMNNNIYHADMTEKISLPTEPEKDIELVAYKRGIYKGFNDASMEEVKYIPDYVREKDKIGRADFTDLEIFTIDGDDTKDIDDAISIHEDKFGNTILGVHIANPSHYIKKDGALYQEAREKSTSTYPTASRVFPMLPEKLSNGICSLNPNVERLAISYIMTFDKDANLIDYDIVESVIKSNIQMTYKKVNDLLDKNIIHPGYEEHKETLLKMKDFSNKLRNKRIERGALMFETEELKINLDEEGKVINIGKRKQGTSEKIIEDFMIATAESYAKFCSKNNISCIYRNHEVPLQFRINDFIEELKLYGLNYEKPVRVNYKKEMRKLLEFIQKEGEDLSKELSKKLIRKLQKANFGINNIGHYALASSGHAPVTSPIRRDNDLENQYVIKESYLDYIDSKKIGEEIKDRINKKDYHITNLRINENMMNLYEENLVLKREEWTERLEKITNHLLEKEIASDKCENEVNQMKLAELMQKEIGNKFYGVITKISGNNIFVELDDLIEGIIEINSLPGKWKYDSKYKYVKSNNDDAYYFGDKVIVSVKEANKKKKQIKFNIEEKIEENEKCKNAIEKLKVKRK